jgi:hypothetical protein
MQRPETKIEKEVDILCNKPSHQVHKNQCIGFIGEYCGTILSTASAIFAVKTELSL